MISDAHVEVDSLGDTLHELILLCDVCCYRAPWPDVAIVPLQNPALKLTPGVMRFLYGLALAEPSIATA